MQQKQKIGILLTNLGTPDAPTPSALRRYLKEFLSDPRVVEMNRLVWWCMLNLVILNIRPAKSARSYQSVWTDEGSPLMKYSLQQQQKLQDQFGDTASVELAMRYGQPSIASGLEKLQAKGCGKILIFPLYPQYSATTTGSTFDAIADVLKTWRYVPELRMINSYHDHPSYISALASSVRNHWKTHGQADRLLMSFHGIPQRYAEQGDPYPIHCKKTAQLLSQLLGLKEDEWFLSFQSRFGREPWLQPYTSDILTRWGKEGMQTVDVICPGFSVDCLETLEEITVENRDYFIESGGKALRYIAALNAQNDHIQALKRVIEQQIQGWVR
ncbi:MAG: ferrochelatase [Mariprofundaceae bacterium]|nr:ferrochelatase [Mariprofundaceae bacterium]